MKRNIKVLKDRIRKTNLFGQVFIAAERVSGYRILRKRFLKLRGYPLNLEKPTTFYEKINWKKIYDRNPLLTITSDKYRVREYIEQRLGRELASEILIPLLYVTDRPETIQFDQLPESYIIKANHGCNWNIIVDNEKANENEIIKKCRYWLKHTYGLTKHEWAYWNIPKKIIIEKLLKDEDGEIPKDYKFFIFHGVCRKVMVFSNRHTNRFNSSYDRDWNFIPKDGIKTPVQPIDKPATYNKMLFIAEGLGKDFNFVRVDLYTIYNKVYFGELTHYPLSGLTKKITKAEDLELGELWNVDI